MSKQTAVEWLFQQIYGDTGHIGSYTTEGKDAFEAFEKAKTMEREQMEMILPSDEHIETFALSVSPEPQKNHETWIAYKASIAGAKWMRDKIKGGEQ